MGAAGPSAPRGRDRPRASRSVPRSGVAAMTPAARRRTQAPTPSAVPGGPVEPRTAPPDLPDPALIGTVAELKTRLAALKERADLSYRSIVRASGGAYSHTTFQGAVRADRPLPRLDVPRDFLRGCGVADDELAPWEDAWHRARSNR